MLFWISGDHHGDIAVLDGRERAVVLATEVHSAARHAVIPVTCSEAPICIQVLEPHDLDVGAVLGIPRMLDGQDGELVPIPRGGIGHFRSHGLSWPAFSFYCSPTPPGTDAFPFDSVQLDYPILSF